MASALLDPSLLQQQIQQGLLQLLLHSRQFHLAFDGTV
jgi:hypothetical protein